LPSAAIATLGRYASALRIPFSLYTAHHRFSPPRTAAGVHVHLFALPTLPVLFGVWPRVLLAAVPFAHGLPLREGAHWAMSAGYQLGRGRPIQDADGNTVGEHVGRNLYCLFDLLAQETAEVPILLRRHLDLGLRHCVRELAAHSAVPEDRVRAALERLAHETDRALRAARQHRHEESRQVYARSCQSRVGEEIASLQAEITLLEDGVEELARGITRATRRLAESPARNGSEPLDLAALPEIAQIRWQPRGLRVVTRGIEVEHDGRRYAMGSFELDMAFDGTLRITNLTNRIGADDHPHVHKGHPRLCNVREGVAKLLGEGQLPEALEVLVDFLRTVRPTEWRTPVWAWPEVGEEGRRGASAAA
jgi:hypothetical protein